MSHSQFHRILFILRHAPDYVVNLDWRSKEDYSLILENRNVNFFFYPINLAKWLPKYWYFKIKHK